MPPTFHKRATQKADARKSDAPRPRIRTLDDLRPLVQDGRYRVGPHALTSETGRQRQDRMVDVDHPVACPMDQRRQLVHVVAVIGVVIRVGLDPLPSCAKQRRLHVGERRARDEDVEVADAAPPPGAQAAAA